MKKRNAEKTKAKILRVATKIFAKKGFSATSVSTIVKASGYNQRMIYHYFGDKVGLYRAVFVDQWNHLKMWVDQSSQKRLALGTLVNDVTVLIREIVDIYFDYMASHPDLVRLFLWEGLEDGKITRSLWQEVSGPLYVQSEFLIRQAQAEGRLDAKHQPAHFIVSLLGAVGYYFAFSHALKDIFGQDPSSKPALKQRKEQVLQFVMSLFVS